MLPLLEVTRDRLVRLVSMRCCGSMILVMTVLERISNGSKSHSYGKVGSGVLVYLMFFIFFFVLPLAVSMYVRRCFTKSIIMLGHVEK